MARCTLSYLHGQLLRYPAFLALRISSRDGCSSTVHGSLSLVKVVYPEHAGLGYAWESKAKALAKARTARHLHLQAACQSVPTTRIDCVVLCYQPVKSMMVEGQQRPRTIVCSNFQTNSHGGGESQEITH